MAVLGQSEVEQSVAFTPSGEGAVRSMMLKQMSSDGEEELVT